MRVLVTGASGFVGRRVCAALLGGGHAVVAPVRSGVSRVPLQEGIEVEVLADPLSAVALAPLLGGVDGVIHLAARVHIMTEKVTDPLAEFRRVNVDGTRAVLTAAQEVGTRRLLYLSSIKVNGESRDTPYSELDTPCPVDPYGQSKLDAEAVVRSSGAGLSWTIVRPPLVYGPGVGGNFRRLLHLAGVASRWPLPLGGIDNLRSMIFVDNLADAIATSVAHPAARDRTFLVSDDHDVSVSELLRRLAVAIGGRSRLFRAPGGLLRQAGLLLGRDADLDRVFGTLRIDCGLIQSTLGWRPPVALDEGLRMTAEWWQGVVPG
jgi:nucleoside-diphosphate-sugar epimerase